MPGCVLQVRGRGLACPPELKPLRTSPDGFVVLVSDADGDRFARQVEDAIAFLEAHGPALAALASSRGFEAAELGFGLWSRIPEQPMQSHLFPARLVELAARCGVGLRVSVYRASDASWGAWQGELGAKVARLAAKQSLAEDEAEERALEARIAEVETEMEELARRQEEATREAEAELAELMRRAIAEGLAEQGR
jgi:hypothetical protein